MRSKTIDLRKIRFPFVPSFTSRKCSGPNFRNGRAGFHRRGHNDPVRRYPCRVEKENDTNAHTRQCAYISGIGETKTKWIAGSPQAALRLNADAPIRFIEKAVDNATNSMFIIDIFQFEASDKRRLAEITSANTFGSIKTNEPERLELTQHENTKRNQTSSPCPKLLPEDNGIAVKPR